MNVEVVRQICSPLCRHKIAPWTRTLEEVVSSQNGMIQLPEQFNTSLTLVVAKIWPFLSFNEFGWSVL